ncbi:MULTISPECIES: RidA family protein [unclassified Nocardioides]|uniref:RidA family protein n=1 Tax=unclassified Nocardioides TaxID=2615069 RepID=UPI0013FD1F78|nr:MULTISPECIES: RidA family protein [unclassified Nocardioides]
MPDGHWTWPIVTPFSQGWRLSGDYDLIFVGGQISVDENFEVIGPDDIEIQTRVVFENIRSVLREAGADMRDIVKLNTFYHHDGEGEALVEFWKKMTRVRLEFLEDPGPAGTAIRTFLGREGLVLEAEAIAAVPRAASGTQS